MINSIVDIIVKGFSERNDHTISKIVSFLNCLLVLLLATSMFFPLQNIFAKHLATLDIELIADIALVVWYCTIFLFWITTSVSFISMIAYSILNNIEKKRDYKTVFKVTDRIHTFFCAAHTSYLNIFDFLTLSSLVLFFVAPERLLSVFRESFQLESVFKGIIMIFVVIGAIECVFSVLIHIIIKWVIPNYYQYKHICED